MKRSDLLLMSVSDIYWDLTPNDRRWHPRPWAWDRTERVLYADLAPALMCVNWTVWGGRCGVKRSDLDSRLRAGALRSLTCVTFFSLVPFWMSARSALRPPSPRCGLGGSLWDWERTHKDMAWSVYTDINTCTLRYILFSWLFGCVIHPGVKR